MNEVPNGVSRRAVIVGGAAAASAAALTGCDSASGEPEQASAGRLANTTEVPVGGGLTVGKVVITQPTAGEFKAFTAVCTHQGCTVSQFKEGRMVCGCHDSEFSLTDGSVVRGPATRALDAVAIQVKDGSITKA